MKELAVHCNDRKKASECSLAKNEKLKSLDCVEGLSVDAVQKSNVLAQMKKPVSSLDKIPLVPIENRYRAERMDHCIAEKAKCEAMSITPPPTPENARICLVGSHDKTTLAAAQVFKVPIVLSETGTEYVSDHSFITYFVLNQFEGPLYDAIYRSKHRILGPPALQQAVRAGEGLLRNNRPIYNYCMKGVITCFTGIRKKDELTRLVDLIHSMGGSIRKDMNTKVTHLICNTSGGEKYQYAMTFRLAVVRPSWVLHAWQNREDPGLVANSEEFTKNHRLKAFEGQKICFFGFPPEEHQHMVDVLTMNGGIPTSLEDPECSHVVMSNIGEHFSDALQPTTAASPKDKNTSSSYPSPQPSPSGPPSLDKEDNNENEPSNCRMEANLVDPVKSEKQEAFIRRLNECQAMGRDDEEQEEEKLSPLPVLPEESETSESSGAQLQEEADHVSMAENENNLNIDCEQQQQQPLDVSPIRYMDENVVENSTPKQSTPEAVQEKTDGVVLKSGGEIEFLNPNNISPILKINRLTDVSLKKISEENDDDEDEDDMDDYIIANKDALKRKRQEDSFDDISIISTDSVASSIIYGSAKKPKLIRTGSITRGLRRSMSFAAIKTPITSMFRSRRNSVDPNSSISSIASIESTFNESIKKPVKEKLRSIRDKITKSNKKETTPKSIKNKGLITSANLDNLKTVCQFKSDKNVNTPEHSKIADKSEVDFKTPIAPALYPSGSSSSKAKKRTSFFRHSMIGGGGSETTKTIPSFETNPAPTATGGVTVEKESSNNASSNLATTELHAPLQPVVTEATDADGDTIMTGAASAAVPTTSTMTMVVDEHIVSSKPEPKNNKTHIVKADWFWYTIQNGYADEGYYLFGDYLDSIANTPGGDRRDSLPISFNKRKRKRLSHRTPAGDGTPLGAGKRRSSVSDAGLLSVSGSFLDCTTSPDKHEGSKKNIITETVDVSIEQPAKGQSMRYNHFTDFFRTESNYVGILDTIVNLFKVPLEEMIEKEPENALLNKSELKAIFSNFLPIHDVHKRMLNRLKEIHGSWSEDQLIGQIILDYKADLYVAYPPYVNFFEQTKETLLQCDAGNPRFHAFLKINQAKPECGRQTLQDLMIRPVQRLPSISLLLNEILKHTSKNNPDHKKLVESLEAIKEVIKNMNEDKRKTDSKVAIFEIFNEIDKCPPHLVSFHRQYISRCEVTELSDGLSGRGDSLVLFLLSDTLEVCKKRSRAPNNAKSPSTNGLNSTRCGASKPYKHVKLMPLSSIRLVVNIQDSPRAFALNCRATTDSKDQLHSFSICDEEKDKIIYLKSLCQQLAENACKADAKTFMVSCDSEELGIDVSDINVGTLSKAFKFATRTRLRVGRALSFNKTPSKLKRAVSSMMTSSFGSTQSLTPASQLAQMKLASCTNINEVGEESSETDSKASSSPTSAADILVAPMSVQPTRKNKNPPMSMAALRRL
ncbi:protein ECT2 [Sabethes cyaneus]|uniref:protein ECT2 n=1 Tax=Sabethes cyaneus TaxID=53552 RepID=UPI00237E9641|nr:protein ECT2 [Sabethes cyaneus]